MRRLLLFVALLTLLGLSTAFAASFDVSSEDIATFSTDVSIPVPTTASKTLYLTGSDSTLPGGLVLESTAGGTTTTSNSPVNGKFIQPGLLGTKLQDDVTRFHSWEIAAPAGGYVLSGAAMLYLFENGNVGPLTAGLFDCSPPTSPAVTTPTSECQQIAGDASSPAGTNLDSEAVVDLGSPNVTILEGHTLRIQVVNLGATKRQIQWGYKSNRPSRLDVTIVQP